MWPDPFGFGTTSTVTTSTSCTNYIYYASNCTSSTSSYGNYQGMANNMFGARPSLASEAVRQGRILKTHTPEAQDRAKELLLSHLSDKQRETFEKNGWFIVVGGKSGKQYRIAANDNLAANIYALDGERITHRLCGHCELTKVPLADHLLAQKMMLECAEDDFLRIANKHAA